MVEEQMVIGKRYLIKHTTNTVIGIIKELRYKIDSNTLHREEAKELSLNEIGRVYIKTQKNIMFDPYVRNHANGSFIIIDELTNDTVGAGIIWYKAGRIPEQNEN